MKYETISNMNTHYFVYSYASYLENQKLLDFDTSVLWGSVPHIWADQYGVEENGLFTENPGIKVYAARPYNYSLYNKIDTVIGMHSLAYYRHLIDLCQSKGVGMLGIDLWGALRDRDSKEQFLICAENLKLLCRYGREKKTKIVIGMVPHGCSALMNTISELKEMISQVDDDNLLVAMEYGLAYLNGESFATWSNTFGNKLKVIFLSDVRANGFGYPLGTGIAPITNTLNVIQKEAFSGIVALKMDRKKIVGFDPLKIDRINNHYLKEKGFI